MLQRDCLYRIFRKQLCHNTAPDLRSVKKQKTMPVRFGTIRTTRLCRIFQSSSRSMATLFDGNALAEQIKQNVRLEVESIRRKLSSFRPKFIAIAVGEHPASRIYLERKKEAATVSGIDCDIINIPSNASEDSLLQLIKDINADVSISGLIVQLPLPNHMSEIRY